jgi:hypothetical protein
VRTRLLLIVAVLAGAFGLVQAPAHSDVVTRSSKADLCLYPMNRPPGICVNLPDRLPML